MRAAECGGPEVATIKGVMPTKPRSMSKMAIAVTLKLLRRSIARAEAMPSVKGHWAMAAATFWSRAAEAITWPPPKEVPHRTTLLRIRLGCCRAKAIALDQSRSEEHTSELQSH